MDADVLRRVRSRRVTHAVLVRRCLHRPDLPEHVNSDEGCDGEDDQAEVDDELPIQSHPGSPYAGVRNLPRAGRFQPMLKRYGEVAFAAMKTAAPRTTRLVIASRPARSMTAYYRSS